MEISDGIIVWTVKELQGILVHMATSRLFLVLFRFQRPLVLLDWRQNAVCHVPVALLCVLLNSHYPVILLLHTFWEGLLGASDSESVEKFPLLQG